VADIFVAHVAADQLDVEILVSHLEQKGWSVWVERWAPEDARLQERVEIAMAGARIVICVSSVASTRRSWMNAIASQAYGSGKLFVVEIADADAGSMVRSFPTAYIGWVYDHERLCEAIETSLRSAPSVAVTAANPVDARTTEPAPTRARLVASLLVAGLLVAGIGFALSRSGAKIEVPFDTAKFFETLRRTMAWVGPQWGPVGGAPNTRPVLHKEERPDNEIARASDPKRSVATTDPAKSINPCADGKACTLVPVFFGTDRKRADKAKRVDFGADRADALQLGLAGITVPRTKRKLGEIPRPTWFETVFRGVPAEGDPLKHFTIPDHGVTVFPDAEAFIAAVRQHAGTPGFYKHHAFVFVHGFWTTFETALYRTAQITYDLGEDTEPFGTAFLYSWPSGSELLDYKSDFDSARLAVEHLTEFLQLVMARSGAEHVHLIAHSMGSWPLLTALDSEKLKAKTGAQINQIILAAPDIDAVEFVKLASLIKTVGNDVTLYASSNDVAMQASRKVHRNAPRAGDVPSSGPVVMRGVYTIDVSAVSTGFFSDGHAEYAERRELLNDIALILRKGIHPPTERTPIYNRVPVGDLTYWKYPQ
jgi:esterase/lipase superfamily enzyme